MFVRTPVWVSRCPGLAALLLCALGAFVQSSAAQGRGPSGACCLPSGSCQDEITTGSCSKLGGVYQGDGSDCGSVTCGACCLVTGDCVFGSDTYCASFSGDGVFQGAGSSCASVTCPMYGACCLPHGACIGPVTAPDCANSNGAYQGDGTDCGGVACPQPGACCLPNGTCRIESNIGGNQCAIDGGTYAGDDIDCGNANCPTGWCCLVGGGCMDQTDQPTCDGMGGAWQGLGTCTQCPEQPGACCHTDGSCSEILESDCLTANGLFQGEGTTCAGAGCGACCLSDGGCTGGSSADCTGLGGAFQGAGSLCVMVICGACCHDDGSCTAGSDTDCTNSGGSFQGPGESCNDQGQCPQPGACCLPDGSCRDEQFVGGAQCIADGGSYQGDDTSCQQKFSCGACCEPGVGCQPLSSTQCSSIIDAVFTIGASCDAIDCFGACCYSDFSCSDVLADDCATAGGTFQGNDTNCQDINCLAGLVRFEQKIGDTEGNFLGVLNTDDDFGWAVARIGDLDLDGVEDMAVGALGDDGACSLCGAVWILFLNADGTVKAHQKISQADRNRFGSSVAAIGDLDGDNVVDLAVGEFARDDGSGQKGGVWILFMNTDGTVASETVIDASDPELSGQLNSGDQFGIAVAALGEINAGGQMRPAIAVGARAHDSAGPDAGAVWVLPLNSDGTVAAGGSKIADAADLDQDDYFGFSVGGLGDLNGDGWPDLAVGAPFDDDNGGPPGPSNRGAVYIYFLNPDGTVLSHQKISDTEGAFAGVLANGDNFGQSVTSLGDLNGDGVGDIVVGADDDNDGGGAGAVWCLFLDTDGAVRSHRKISAIAGGFAGALSSGDEFGKSVTSLGDLDGDGKTDIAVGAPNDDDGGADRGAVWILFLQSTGDVQFDDPEIFETAGEPNIHAVGNLDGSGAFPFGPPEAFHDVVTVIPDPNPLLPGQIEIFINQGLDIDDNWLGLSSALQVSVGANPSGVAMGYFNSDSFLDLAVANAQDGTITILINDGLAPPRSASPPSTTSPA